MGSARVRPLRRASSARLVNQQAKDKVGGREYPTSHGIVFVGGGITMLASPVAKRIVLESDLVEHDLCITEAASKRVL